MILRSGLGQLGRSIGENPKIFFSASFLISILLVVFSFYAFKPILSLSFDDGYTSNNAASIAELRGQIKFFGDRGKPWYMALFAAPRNTHSSITNTKEFNELENFYKGLKKNLIINKEKNYTFNDICGDMCNFNEVVFTTNNLAFFGLQWPVTSIFGYKSNIGKHFFDVKTDEKGYIKQANLSALYFMMFTDSNETKADLREFERVADLACQEHNNNSNATVRVTLHGSRGMELEIKRGLDTFTCLFAVGIAIFAAAQLTIFIIVGKANGSNEYAKIIGIWLVAFLTPLLALADAFAVFNFLRFEIYSVMFLTPILALCLGSEVLLIYYTWLKVSSLTKPEASSIKLQQVFETCMPSLTAVFAPSAVFIVLGMFYPVPAYRSLCMLIGLVVIFIYFLSIFFFAPILAWTSSDHDKLSQKEDEVAENNHVCSTIGTPNDCCGSELAVSKSMRIASFAVFGLLFVLPLFFGIGKIRGNLDYRELLPQNSRNKLGVHYMSDVVWPQFLHVVFIVENPPDFTNRIQYGQFKEMIFDLEGINGTIGPHADMTWTNDFLRYTGGNRSNPVLQMDKFQDFITDDIYKAWNSGVRYTTNGNQTKITKMVYMVAFNGTRTLADKADLFKRCRQVVNKYPNFGVLPFDTEVGMADVISILPNVNYIIFLIVGFCFIAVFFAIVGNAQIFLENALLYSVLMLDLLAIPALFGFDLNPFTTTFLLFACAMAPKYTTHVGYFYQQKKNDTGKSVDQVEQSVEAINKCCVPVALNALLCFLLLFPVLFSGVKIFIMLAVYSILLPILGFVAGLFLFPVFLGMTPKNPQ